MELKQKIEAWDQKSAEYIQVVFDECHTDGRFPAELIDLIPQTKTETGATWLLKAYLETGKQLSNQKIGQLFNDLNHLQHWEAKLHVLQCLPYFQIDEANKNQVEQFIRECLLNKNKFVRAWAYNGFYALSNQYSEFSDEFERLFENGMKNEAPSVKARLRNLKKGKLNAKS